MLILYEEYLRQANPELLPALDTGLPGMQWLKQFDFDRVGRVAIFEVVSVSGTAPGADSSGWRTP